MKTAEDAIKLLVSLGYPTAELRVHQAHSDVAAWTPIKIPDAFRVSPGEETADEYFNAFGDGGLKAPPFAFRLLAVGRCFTLTRGQLQVLRDRYSVPTSNQATVVDMEQKKEKCNSITFYFASRGKHAKLRVANEDLISWWNASRILDEQYDKEALGREASKPKVKRGKSLSNLADKWLNDEFGLGI